MKGGGEGVIGTEQKKPWFPLIISILALIAAFKEEIWRLISWITSLI